jgi:hypothetical protein
MSRRRRVELKERGAEKLGRGAAGLEGRILQDCGMHLRDDAAADGEKDQLGDAAQI